MVRRTKADAEATREALLDAAEAIFYAKGVARASLQDIARQAGLTRGGALLALRRQGRSVSCIA